MSTAILASPAFLSSLRPPPLPLWAQTPTSAALSSTRLSLLLAHTVTTAGFSIARSSTRFAFALARGVLSPIASSIGNVLDHTLGLDGGNPGPSTPRGPIGATLHGALNRAEQLALFGIAIGSEITRASLGTASSTVAYLEGLYGNDEALRALETFLKLVQREHGESLEGDPYDQGGLSHWSTVQIVKAAGTWAALQSATAELDGKRFAPELEELDLATWGRKKVDAKRGVPAEVFWEVTEEQILAGGEEVIEASLTSAPADEGADDEGETEDEKTRRHLRRFSKLSLGSYGGIGMVFFGVKLPTQAHSGPGNGTLTPNTLSNQARKLDEAALAEALGSHLSVRPQPKYTDEDGISESSSILEAEMGAFDARTPMVPSATPNFNLWGLLNGTHDTAVLESLGELAPGSSLVDPEVLSDDDDEPTTTSSALMRVPQLGRKKARRPPRFFVVTDHPNHKVLCCLRGTMTLDDLATDLACEPAEFDAEEFWDEETKERRFSVHGGMWEVALAMGGREGPVTRAIGRALRANPGYALFLTGHSLGAGVAGLLGIMWANPGSCLTSSKSGLPPGRTVKVYGFAPPCTTDAALSTTCRKLIHSFVLGSDAVARFSLGHIRDIRSAAAWLCYANDNPEESCNNILSRLLAYKRGRLDDDPFTRLEEETWFAALRTTLEANMTFATLFPPGEILWLVKPNDLILPGDVPGEEQTDLRLFKVTGRVDVVFKQMLFTSRMLSSHLPSKYMQAIADGI